MKDFYKFAVKLYFINKLLTNLERFVVLDEVEAKKIMKQIITKGLENPEANPAQLLRTEMPEADIAMDNIFFKILKQTNTFL